MEKKMIAETLVSSGFVENGDFLIKLEVKSEVIEEIKKEFIDAPGVILNAYGLAIEAFYAVSFSNFIKSFVKHDMPGVALDDLKQIFINVTENGFKGAKEKLNIGKNNEQDKKEENI